MKFANPYVAAAYGHIDAVIDPKDTRMYITHSLKVSTNKTVIIPEKNMASLHSKTFIMKEDNNIQNIENEKLKFEEITINEATYYTIIPDKYKKEKLLLKKILIKSLHLFQE